jgi:uncharacterized repeat protein (TIGR02543 family)
VKGDAYGTLPVPTRPNYTFDGWYTAASGGTKVTATTIVTSSSNHSLYAHWTSLQGIGSIRLNFNVNGGGTVSPSYWNVDPYVPLASYGPLPIPTRSASGGWTYSFHCWTTQAVWLGSNNAFTIDGTSYVDGTSNTETIYAAWKKIDSRLPGEWKYSYITADGYTSGTWAFFRDGTYRWDEESQMFGIYSSHYTVGHYSYTDASNRVFLFNSVLYSGGLSATVRSEEIGLTFRGDSRHISIDFDGHPDYKNMIFGKTADY